MKKIPSSLDSSGAERRERRSYLFGAAIALGLTLLAFAMVRWKLLPQDALMAALGVLAIAQIIVHFRFFLHVGFKRNAEDLHLVAFTALILLIMVAGTVWIMGSLAVRMSLFPSP